MNSNTILFWNNLVSTTIPWRILSNNQHISSGFQDQWEAPGHNLGRQCRKSSEDVPLPTQFATLYRRTDTCLLFLNLGVKPELTVQGHNSISQVTNYFPSERSDTNAINLYRCFLNADEDIDDLIYSESDCVRFHCLRANEVEWLWAKNTELCVSNSVRRNQREIIRRFWAGFEILCRLSYFRHPSQQPRLPKLSMNSSILEDLRSGQFPIISMLFSSCYDTVSGYTVGASFLDWLLEMNLDPSICVANELSNVGDDHRLQYRKTVFERNCEQRWFLGFEWAVDPGAPAYNLLSEYSALVIEIRSFDDWPFDGWKYADDRAKCESHFSRRMATKALEERVRRGQKTTSK
ncbi:hypothetical protein EK21DRAFT_92000 [Setomelanomma holmii]|uniref:Uncharacterized protein n=1 Tax=Setomelanomma holmii TaxID=210430 RepID=A0A9P4H254_9PLEO|nr:hypothetical protein EK21DRAFT_92000 [Setomelanomma holmii]